MYVMWSSGRYEELRTQIRIAKEESDLRRDIVENKIVITNFRQHGDVPWYNNRYIDIYMNKILMLKNTLEQLTCQKTKRQVKGQLVKFKNCS